MKIRNLVWIGIMAAVGMVWAEPAQRLIPYQGQLTDQHGVRYNQGQYTLTFNLYADAVGGVPLWTERHEKVGVINGMVNLFLGSIAPLNDHDFSQTRYLGITIDADGNYNTADPEMIPRQLIIPAFQAKNSEKLAGHDWSTLLEGASNDPSTAKILASKLQADGITANQIKQGAIESDELKDGAVTSADLADGGVEEVDLSIGLQNRLAMGLMPAGMVMPFAGPTNTIPVGWLLCDGSAVSSAQYPNLFAAIGAAWGDASDDGFTETDFRLPEMRGLFLRGVDHGAGNDPNAGSRMATGVFSGSVVGSRQSDAFKAHAHDLYGMGDADERGDHWNYIGPGHNSSVKIYNNNPIKNKGGSETRPKNVYVNYVIKY